ncbi:hypothetical protein [Ornithinimicrobium cavernae]|uniref:hypothetical protein n=1 Tax=Ornithinimicrobium cavernae TaxID=2666047 RepID=UPI000D687E6D|nr:hypothetical protein [Ornithinimicrobium cavernae]
MKKSTINLHTRLRGHLLHLREEGAAARERGGIGVEYVVIAVGVFALATLIIAGITAWATGKLEILT